MKKIDELIKHYNKMYKEAKTENESQIYSLFESDLIELKSELLQDIQTAIEKII